MYSAILEKIRNDTTISTIISDAQRKKFKKLMLFIGCAFGVAILLGIVLQFKWIGWGVAILSATLVSTFALCYYKFSKPTFLLGEIQSINHDYKVVPLKGTAGFYWTRGLMKNTHTLNVYILTSENSTEKVYAIVCPSQYEEVLGIGDTILYHPYLSHPAILTHKTKCICMKCGRMQSTDHTVCFECQTTLFNFNTVYQSIRNRDVDHV